MSDLTSFDLLILALVVGLALLGAVRGFTTEALNLAAWVAAVFAVRLFHEEMTGKLTGFAGSEGKGAILAFLLLFLGVLIVGKLIAGWVGGATKASVVGPVDRVLGLGLGAAKGLIAASAIFLLAEFATHLFVAEKSRPAWLAQSQVTPILIITSKALVNWVKEVQADAPAADGAGPDREGYSAKDRAALDDLLNKGEGTAV
ncbi:CvpA family protein [Sandaracinobacteroides saxicola]|uniref:CvpA family protein n=1 Tax=Sandaracinobacteroides saxicola TaxID=2759707 RepID=A0A7G5IIY8_9SPHN|nr:CvpA family protein [Sandaracinobacteroides saxicola]QMW23330.1 CvpA family protein [Sandaracinobacteroides saxicola]